MNKDGNTKKGYKPAYCDQVSDFMAKGYTVSAYAGHISHSRKTVYKWIKQYEEFKEAVEVGKAKLEKYLIDVGHDMMTGVIEKGNATVWIFMCKNCLGWRDKTEQEISFTPPTIEVKTHKDDTYTIKSEE